jgi:hypothetical protein
MGPKISGHQRQDEDRNDADDARGGKRATHGRQGISCPRFVSAAAASVPAADGWICPLPIIRCVHVALIHVLVDGSRQIGRRGHAVCVARDVQY